MMKKKSKGKKKSKKLTPSDLEKLKLQSEHRKLIRSIFARAGFSRVSGVAEKEFTFNGQAGDIDDLYVFENVVVALEYTTAKDVGEHLKPKKILFDKILSDASGFLDFIRNQFPKSADLLQTGYHESQVLLKIVYCSRFSLDDHYKSNVPGPVYLDYPDARYFGVVSSAVKKSSRHELLKFLEVPHTKVGYNKKINTGETSIDYHGLVLPEAHSHFAKGFKVVTFYADPETLLKMCYVLRKDGWHDSSSLYQRMISSSKISQIRQYLKKQKRVFINNIIVTLPSEVKPMSGNGETIDVSTLTETKPVKIKFPDAPNSICLIDGQHRVFAYHETQDDDKEIANLRTQQNLLVTGIIYPKNYKAFEKEKFEARLFLEINSTQATAKSDLKQAIELVLDPFTVGSIASRVLTKLARKGPLSGHIEQYFYEKDKLKTSSIVSYGMKPLVKTTGSDSLFSIWQSSAKTGVEKKSDQDALNEYTDFCVEKINGLLIAIRKNIKSGRWTTDPKAEGKVLSTTYINSFLIVLRLLVENKADLSQANLDNKLKGLDHFNFDAFHSSQYKRMAEQMVEQHFDINPKN